ncbi:MAG: hypothetical protein HFH09_01960 [Bacilli bacterium]|jgi:hypothetical protein|nr:hypothetical protein [Bacilli bacterium]
MNEKLNEQASAFTITAVVVGFLIIPNLNAKQQNDLGNWLMLVGQVLCTNAARIAILKDNETTSSLSNQDLICLFEETIKAMQQEIDELKNKTT